MICQKKLCGNVGYPPPSKQETPKIFATKMLQKGLKLAFLDQKNLFLVDTFLSHIGGYNTPSLT